MNRTAVQLVIIVLMVALVAIVYLVTDSHYQFEDPSFTGNVVSTPEKVGGYSNIGQVMFVVFMLGCASYLYFNKNF